MTTFDARLATRVSRDVRQRLRLTAAVAGASISATLTEVLDRALPTHAQLAAGVATRGAPKTEASIALARSAPDPVDPDSFWAHKAAELDAQEQQEVSAGDHGER